MPSWWFDSTLRTQYRRISPNLIVDGERTGRRILALFLVMALISALPVFSFADGEELVLKDSGSSMVSMMALRSIAADDGISLAAAEGNSGQFGYNIKPVDSDPFISFHKFTAYNRISFSYFNLPSGTYTFKAEFGDALRSLGVYNLDSGSYISNSGGPDGSSAAWSFTLTDSTSIRLDASFNIDVVPSVEDIEYTKFEGSVLLPVEGISCGYIFNSGVKDDDDISARLELSTWDFGSQPAGNYIINIYTYGQNYDVDFDIVVGSDITQDRKVAVLKSNGLYTCLISHAGGDLVLESNFTYKKSTLNSPDIGSGSVSGSFYEGTGSVIGTSSSGFVSSGNWLFNITDVVAVPLDAAGLEQFGVFGPMIGFLRDGFSSIKSNVVNQFSQLKTSLTTEFTNLKTSITTQFTQLKTLITNQFTSLKNFLNEQYSGAVSSQLSQDMNSAESMIQQENQFTESINTQITEQSSKVDPVTVLDGIEGSSSVFSSMLWVSSIVSSGIDGMGVFQFLIYVPMILGVVTLVIGRGASLAGRRPRSQAAAGIRVYDRRRK